MTSKSISLIEKAKQNEELGELVFHIVTFWIDHLQNNPKVLVRAGIDKELEIFRQELLNEDEHNKAEEILKLLRILK